MDLIDSFKVSKADLENNFEKHRIEDLGIVSYPQAWAWELCSPKRFAEPLRYLPKSGARTWINLSFPERAKHVHLCLADARKPDCSSESMKDIAKNGDVIDFGKYKKPYWRVLNKNLDVSERFSYQANDEDGKRVALVQALEFQLKLAKLEDQGSCMQLPEIKKFLAHHALDKNGTLNTLRIRMLRLAVVTGAKLDIPEDALCVPGQVGGEKISGKAKVGEEKNAEKKQLKVKVVAGKPSGTTAPSKLDVASGQGANSDIEHTAKKARKTNCKFFAAGF